MGGEVIAPLDPKLVRQIASQAKGRCHSCIHSRAFDLPSGTRYWCRAFGSELDAERHQEVRGCPRWAAFSPPVPATPPLQANPLLRDLINSEDLLFWRLKCHLDEWGFDLKTVLAIAHPGTDPERDLRWIDSLDARFATEEPWELAQVIGRLRALGYQSLAAMVELISAHISHNISGGLDAGDR